MYTSPEQALQRAATLTFEEIGFLSSAPELADEQKNLPTPETSSVAFRSETAAGNLVLKTDSGLLAVLAANMLGDDEPLAAEVQRDALGEMANVICGNALPAIFGKKEVFRLEAPQFAFENASGETASPAAKVRVNLDEGCADVLLYLSNS